MAAVRVDGPMADLEAALAAYEAAMHAVDVEALAEAPAQALTALLARDALEAALPDGDPTAEQVLRIAATDEEMRGLRGPLSELEALDGWRETVRPADTAWWWEAPTELESSGQVGWLDTAANLLTALFILLSASFTVGIFQALSTDGISWGETFGTILQASGLALVGSGTLTERGRRRVARLLSRIGISHKLQAEVMCLAAAALTAILWAGHDQVLPRYFQDQGVAAYEIGELRRAETHFQRALALRDDPTETLIYLGRIAETVEDYDTARGYYQQAMLTGEPVAFNYLGRVLLTQPDPDPDHASALLYLGLQRVTEKGRSGRDVVDAQLERDLHRNLAWALYEQAELRSNAGRAKRLRTAAEQHLATVDEKRPTPDSTAGGGVVDVQMQDCVRAAHDRDDKRLRAKCVDNARPETIGEFRFIVDEVVPNCPLRVETNGIIQSETGTNNSMGDQYCAKGSAADSD